MMFPFKTVPGQIAAFLVGFTIVAYLIVAGAPRNWGVQIPDVAHTYGIRLNAGVDMFFRPAVGWFIEHGLWACLGVAVAAPLVELSARALKRALAR